MTSVLLGFTVLTLLLCQLLGAECTRITTSGCLDSSLQPLWFIENLKLFRSMRLVKSSLGSNSDATGPEIVDVSLYVLGVI